MMASSSRFYLLAGLMVIVVVNAIALGGAAYNRSGDPDSVLALDQRELRPGYEYRSAENSGVSLQLDWRYREKPAVEKNYQRYDNDSDALLGPDKLRDLGFDLRPPVSHDDKSYVQQDISSREVFLVMQLDGATRRHSIELRQQSLQLAEKQSAGAPQDEALRKQAEEARRELASELADNSRLFLVDIGTDHDRLREKYPDRNAYPILRARMEASWGWGLDNKWKPEGRISEVYARTINVPRRFHGVERGEYGAHKAKYRIELAFGKRLEPWIRSMSAL